MLLSINGTAPGEWTFLAEGETAQSGSDIAVPLDRFTAENEAFFASVRSVGAVISTDTAYSELAPLVNKLAFVVIDFPSFGDGRGFSLAVRLRKDLGFKGEIRATGHTIPDQAQHLLRSGFDTVEVTGARKDAFERSLNRFKEFYQADYRGKDTVPYKRHKPLEKRNVS